MPKHIEHAKDAASPFWRLRARIQPMTGQIAELDLQVPLGQSLQPDTLQSAIDACIVHMTGTDSHSAGAELIKWLGTRPVILKANSYGEITKTELVKLGVVLHDATFATLAGQPWQPPHKPYSLQVSHLYTRSRALGGGWMSLDLNIPGKAEDYDFQAVSDYFEELSKQWSPYMELKYQPDASAPPNLEGYAYGVSFLSAQREFARLVSSARV